MNKIIKNNLNNNININKDKKKENSIKPLKSKEIKEVKEIKEIKKNNMNQLKLQKNKEIKKEKEEFSKTITNKIDSTNIINNSENTNISNIPNYTEASSLIKENKKIITNLSSNENHKNPEGNIFSQNMIYQKIESPYDLYSYDPSSFSMDSLIVDSKAIRALSFSQNGKILTIGTNSKSLKLYDFTPINDKFLMHNNNSSSDEFISLKLLFEKPNHHAGSIYCLDFSPNDKLIATGSNDKMIKIFVIPDFNENMKEILELAIPDQKGTIRSVIFPPTEDNFVFSGGSGFNGINMWDTESGKRINSLMGHKESINSLKFSVDDNNSDKLLGSCGNDNLVCFHDYRTNNPTKTIEIKNHGEINDICFTNDYICTVHNDGYINLYNNIKETIVKEFKGSDKEIRAVNFSKDGKFLITASFDKKISIFDVNDDLKLVKYLEHDDRAVNCKWHPDKPIIVSSSADNTARIWTPKVY